MPDRDPIDSAPTVPATMFVLLREFLIYRDFELEPLPQAGAADEAAGAQGPATPAPVRPWPPTLASPVVKASWDAVDHTQTTRIEVLAASTSVQALMTEVDSFGTHHPMHASECDCPEYVRFRAPRHFDASGMSYTSAEVDWRPFPCRATGKRVDTSHWRCWPKVGQAYDDALQQLLQPFSDEAHLWYEIVEVPLR